MGEIRCIFFDIDGVLTDGNVYIDERGHESKSYRLTEIDAINTLVQKGYSIIAITGEDTPIVDVFKKRIEWTEFVKGCKNKLFEVQRICKEFGVERENICYVGDGKYDVPAIKYAGLGVCPDNAINAAKDVADIVLSGRGGENCINELCEYIIKLERDSGYV